jgi:hydrogenase small subunit
MAGMTSTSKTAYWLQTGGCGGDSMALLDLQSPDLLELLRLLDLEILYHPSLSTMDATEHDALTRALVLGERPLDLLIVEGAVVRGPGGTGMFDVSRGRPRKDLVSSLASVARWVVAVGTCAAFGGVSASSDVVEATGLQFLRAQRGGFLGAGFVAKSGLPVINLPGCPAHPETVAAALGLLMSGAPLTLDEHQTPVELYGVRVHQGCTRNEYHEYRVEELGFGERGCLFFHMGCQGPMAHGACNRVLWNQRSSKTRVGVPCFGCTRPEFPRAAPFFQTPNVEGLPLELPDGINRPHYLAYKTMAAAAAPERLRKRSSGV